MALVSQEGRFLQTNTPLQDMLGYTDQEFMAPSFIDMLHPADAKINARLIRQLQRGEVTSIRNEARFQHKNGGTMWANVNASSIYDAQNRLSYFLVQIDDISERKHLEEQVQESLRLSRRQLEISQTLASARTDQEILETIAQKADYYPQAAFSLTLSLIHISEPTRPY